MENKSVVKGFHMPVVWPGFEKLDKGLTPSLISLWLPYANHKCNITSFIDETFSTVN